MRSMPLQNGVMKSSLAQTFKDIADGAASKIEYSLHELALGSITDENAVELSKESILVIRPYDEVFGHSEKTSTLLVDSVLRKEYEQIHIAIDVSKNLLFVGVEKSSLDQGRRIWKKRFLQHLPMVKMSSLSH